MKKIIATMLCLAMLLGMTACGGGTTATSTGSTGTDTPAASTGEPAAQANTDGTAEAPAAEEPESTGPKVFRYGTDANSTTFDPASDLQTNSGSFLVHAVGETLWTVDSEGNMVPKLAESVEFADDDSSMTIKLRQGVKFSNGNDLTADDVLFTLQHMMEMPRTASMYTWLDLENSKAEDDYTVVLAMNSYDASLTDMLANASCMILDKETCEADPSYGWLYGTGPYKLAGDGQSDKSGWEESVKYTLVRNDLYWGDQPYYDELDVQFYSEESTRYADFQAGNLDAVFLTEATYINNLNNGAVMDSSLVSVEEPGVVGFEMAASDVTTGAFADINVRKAFAHCLDITAMVEGLGEGVYKPATSLVSEDCWAYKDLGAYEYDEAKAKEYMEKAGYSVDNPLTIAVYAEGTAWYSKLLEAAQAYCAKVGINLDLTGVADFATILPVLLSGQQDMTIGSASNGSGKDPACQLQQFGPLSDNILIRSTDPEQVELFNKGISSHDQKERTEIYQKFMQNIHDNYYFVPLYCGTKNYGVNNAHSSFVAAIDNSCTVDPTLLID